MLDFIYYPVSFILWCWHWVFGHVFGESSGIAWALGIVFLVWTLRAIMFKPFVKQVRSMRTMQEFAPEIKKIQKKYANDRQRQAQEMQKLQREHGFSPLGGCLPMLIQIPVFIGLFHVLRSFGNSPNENYFFDAEGVSSYLQANLFGAGLSNFITQPADLLARYGEGDRTAVILVSIPLMLLASVLTHLTARHSVDRQNPESATAQTAIMNKLTLYIFPIGVLVFGFFFPIGLLLYWLSNNFWTLMQQRLVYRRIDREEEEKKAAAVEKRTNLAPKPGAKPDQAKKRTAPAPGVKPAPNAKAAGTAKKKPVAGPKPAPNAKAAGTAKSADAEKVAGAKPAGTAKPKSTDTPKPAAGNGDGSTVSGLSADRSRKKNTGRKNR